MVFELGYVQTRIDHNKKCRRIAGNFDFVEGFYQNQ